MDILSHSLLKKAVTSSRDGITISDNTRPDNPLVWVNEAFERLTGYASQEVIGRNCRFLQGEDFSQPSLSTVKAAVLSSNSCLVTLRNYRKDGSMFWNELSLSPIRNSAGIVTHFIGIQKDVTAQITLNQTLQHENQQLKSSKAALEYLVHVDALTGLHNRRYLEEQLLIQWKIATRHKIQLTVFMIDIDNFKGYNDIYGHLMGDEVIKAVSAELNSCFGRGADFVARYGGEEFLILAVGMNQKGAKSCSEMLVQKVEALKIPHSGSPVGTVTISVGYSQLVPHLNIAPAHLIQQADQALYQAKDLGKNTAIKYGDGRFVNYGGEQGGNHGGD